MRKNWLIFKFTLQDYFVYRINFFLWRFRSLVSFFVLVFFWQAIYFDKKILFGYSKSQIIAYVVGVAFLKSLIFESRSFDELPGMIKNGSLLKWLIRPLDVFRFFFIRDCAAKILNVVFSIGEIFLVVKLLDLNFYLPTNLATLFLFLAALILSTILYFLIGILISSFCFWLEEVWATRWLFGIIFLEFLSGVYFPIDLLPSALVKVISLTPFPYLIYFPLKIWTQGINSIQAAKTLMILALWIVLTWYLIKKAWQKGLKKYAAYGG